MENRHIVFYTTGLEDGQGREILKNQMGVVHKVVDGIPHTTTEQGEPLNPILHFQIVDINETPGYDLGDYPDGFDPELYGLEEKTRNWKSGPSL